jgi:hypothetical protein
VILIAPKLSDRILNNDLLRFLAKTQMDAEPGIRTNTCILLGRLSKYLQPTTNRKVLIPAFARSLRDPFLHARIAGLMALMATVECYEKEDVAGRVIPAMAVCLVDKEKPVREQAFKAIDLFVKRVQTLAASMVRFCLFCLVRFKAFDTSFRPSNFEARFGTSPRTTTVIAEWVAVCYVGSVISGRELHWSRWGAGRMGAHVHQQKGVF